LTPYAREAFLAVVDELYAAGIVTTVDTMALCAYAETCSTFRQATEMLAELSSGGAGAGLVARMPSGAVVVHPVLAIKNRAQRDLLRAASEIGLSPAGRVGLQGVEPLDETDLAIMEKYNLVGATGHT